MGFTQRLWQESCPNIRIGEEEHEGGIGQEGSAELLPRAVPWTCWDAPNPAVRIHLIHQICCHLPHSHFLSQTILNSFLQPQPVHMIFFFFPYIWTGKKKSPKNPRVQCRWVFREGAFPRSTKCGPVCCASH